MMPMQHFCCYLMWELTVVFWCRGRVVYQLTLSLWRLLSLCYCADTQLEVLKLTKHMEDGTIKARWRVRCLPFHSLLLHFYQKDRSHLYRYHMQHEKEQHICLCCIYFHLVTLNQRNNLSTEYAYVHTSRLLMIRARAHVSILIQG